MGFSLNTSKVANRQKLNQSYELLDMDCQSQNEVLVTECRGTHTYMPPEIERIRNVNVLVDELDTRNNGAGKADKEAQRS